MASQGRLGGEASHGPPPRRPRSHPLRPPRVRPLQQAGERLRLRHLHRRPPQARDRARPTRFRPRRLPMGGGEVARYFGKYGSDDVSRAVFMSAVPPFLLKTADNPEGVDGAAFEGIKAGVLADRPAFLSQFLTNFFNVDQLGGTLVSDQVVQLCWNVAAGASPKGTLDFVPGFSFNGFPNDLRRLGVSPVIIPRAPGRILTLPAPRHRPAANRDGSK